nr:MAG TPA: hypothetical protein [Microviridae sp.]
MAKKGSSGPRDVHNIAIRRMLAPRITTPRPIRLTPNLQLVEDRRTWHPDGLYRPIRTITSKRPRLRPVAFTSSKLRNTLPVKLGFDIPKKVAICVRRKQRKEVLFAKHKTGAGSGRRSKAPKRNQWSDVKC